MDATIEGGTRRVLRFVGPAVGLVLFAVAIAVLHRELGAYHFAQILAEVDAVPRVRVLLALAAAAMSYLAASASDALAMASIGKNLGYHRVALASFVANCFSNSVGFGLLTGGSVRYRLYSSWDLTLAEITRVLVFSAATLWLGFLALAGTAFVWEAPVLPALGRLPLAASRPIGALFLAAAVAYLPVALLVRKPLRVGGLEIALPPPRFYPFQVVVSVLDWAFAGATLYVLLPRTLGLSFAAFLGLYLLALTAGMLSQVPGGLGVFESVFVVLLSGRAAPPEILGALALYRVVYYLIPLAVAALSLAAHEMLVGREGVARAARFLRGWSAIIVPPFLALATLAAGALLLFSGATPGVWSRIRPLARLVPLSIIEGSHFLASIAGLGLLLLARGIQRRVDASYVAAAALLSAGILFSLLKGFDYEEAIVLGVVLIALLPSRRYFYRTSSLVGRSLSPAWIAAVLAVVGGTAWLTFFSHKHVEISQQLWWQFTLRGGGAPRSLRALTGVVVALIVWAAWTLLRPRPRLQPRARPLDWPRVERIVRSSERTLACLAFLGDKRFLFCDEGDAFIMYGVAGSHYISMGDPVGPEARWKDLAWAFRQLADRNGAGVAFYEIEAASLPLYLDLGLTALKLGEEARVDLPAFSLDGASRRGLRYALSRLEREGCAFEVLPSESACDVLSELEPVSQAWLAEKKARERGFTLGWFRPDYLSRLPVAVVRKAGRAVAFATIWAVDSREEASVDLMRHLPDAPNGIMDFLFASLLLWARGEGYRWFNLGMAPFAGLEEHPLAPFWSRAGAFLFRHGEQFYNFQGLRQYKEKFAPVWRPKYLACPGGLALPSVLAALASLSSGSLGGLISR